MNRPGDKQHCSYSHNKAYPDKGHVWVEDEWGNVDIFAYHKDEYHNGPRCALCGYGFCHHCNPEGPEVRCKGL